MERNHCCEKSIQNVRAHMPKEEVLYRLADLFKICGDYTRIKILYALFQEELCVGDIAQLIEMSQSAVSHQLRVLKQGKLVRFRRSGKTILYSLDDQHIKNIFDQGLDHILE